MFFAFSYDDLETIQEEKPKGYFWSFYGLLKLYQDRRGSKKADIDGSWISILNYNSRGKSNFIETDQIIIGTKMKKINN